MYADEEREVPTIMVSKSLISGDEKKYFCVRIQGTSMNRFEVRGKTIADGSIVLIDTSDRSGSISSAAYLCVVDGMATVKKIRKEGDLIYLVPESHDEQHTPIILSAGDQLEISGKIVDVFNFG